VLPKKFIMFSNRRLKEILLRKKLAAQKDIANYEARALAAKIPLETFLLQNKIIAEEKLYQAAAEYLKMPYADMKNIIIRKDILFLVPETIAETHKIIAYDKKENVLQIATSEPEDQQTFEFIAKKTGSTLNIGVCSPAAAEEALKQYRLSLKAEFKEISDTPIEEQNEEKLQELAEHVSIIRIVDSFLEHAIFEGASDIHIEPSERELIIRYRVDGILRKVMSLPKGIMPGIVARIKILSNLKLDEHRLPQDGRFKIENKTYRISIRVSILPIFDGEKIVMRLLNESSRALTLEELGFRKEQLELVSRSIKRPHGMILVTGPTGSGKTTTLYSILNILNKPEVNISTIEDPIEYKVPGINQSQVNPKINFTFASGLRALLRQDPNIIMVGEIRDNETADIAVHAALTGHLVLSTLHTNDAVTTLPRLADMGVPPFLIAFTANLIIAQRLVRKVCGECKKKYKLNNKDIEELGKLFNVPDVISRLHKLGIVKKGAKISSLEFTHGVGCPKCNNTGYKGRQGIYEILEVTPAIKAALTATATAEDIAKAADKQGMINLVMDGFIKALGGSTSLEEIIRVTKE
jgi:type IV pilus assembly protein PilB